MRWLWAFLVLKKLWCNSCAGMSYEAWTRFPLHGCQWSWDGAACSSSRTHGCPPKGATWCAVTDGQSQSRIHSDGRHNRAAASSSCLVTWFVQSVLSIYVDDGECAVHPSDLSTWGAEGHWLSPTFTCGPSATTSPVFRLEHQLWSLGRPRGR